MMSHGEGSKLKCVKQSRLYPIETKRSVKRDSHEMMLSKKKLVNKQSIAFAFQLNVLGWDSSAGGNTSDNSCSILNNFYSSHTNALDFESFTHTYSRAH